jgi:hypothetical protein
VSAQIRSIADRNEALGLPADPDPGPVYVTKEEASEAQSVEAIYTGGMVPRGSLAAQMQVFSPFSYLGLWLGTVWLIYYVERGG